jgi:anti-sigma factor RsiW
MSAYFDGEFASSGRERMQRHLDECHDCRRLLADLREILDWLKRLPAPSGGADSVQIAAAVRVRLRDPPTP